MSTHRISKAAAKSPAKAIKPHPVIGSQTFGNVFDALADTPQQAANMRARADLAHQITAIIRGKGWTQKVAAQYCGVTQPRINDLLSGHISRFSLDALVNIASAIGTVHMEVEELEYN
jgi:predicted XRE-type DNA-binding protein